MNKEIRNLSGNFGKVRLSFGFILSGWLIITGIIFYDFNWWVIEQ